MREIYRKLVSFQDAKDLVYKYFRPLGLCETVPVDKAAGRIAADDIFSPMDLPPFSRSTVDGYAVRWEDVSTSGNDSPVTLKVKGEAVIGKVPEPLSGEGSCMKISTGAIIPPSANSVIMVENVTENGDFIEVNSEVRYGENIAVAGSDIYRGAMVISAGTIIKPHDTALLSSLGIENIKVWKKIRISVISTGNELIEPGEEYTYGKIYDGNSRMILSTLNQFAFIEAFIIGIVGDDPDKIREKILKASSKSNVVIISGGSSAGESDFVKSVIGEFDPGLIFHGIMVKPGKPTALAMKDEIPIIGLPGFPVSASLMLWSLFIPGIMKMAGVCGDMQGHKSSIKIKTRLDPGLQNLIPVISDNDDKGKLFPVAGLSGSISRLSGTSGFISIPGRSKYLDPEETVDFFSWEWERNIHVNRVVGTIDSGNAEYIRSLIPDALMTHADPFLATSLFFTGSVSAIVLRYQGQLNTQQFLSLNQFSDFRLAVIGKKCICFSSNGHPVYENPVKELMKARTIRAPPAKFLEGLLNKSEAVRELAELLKSKASSFTHGPDADFEISILDVKDTQACHNDYLFTEAALLKETGSSNRIESDPA